LAKFQPEFYLINFTNFAHYLNEGIMSRLNLLIIVLSFSSIALFSQTKISPDSAGSFINKKVTVIGIVDEIHITNTGNYLLNMGGKYPDNTFTAVIFAADTSNFGNIKIYEGKGVEITGVVKDYKGSPEIVLKKKNQIKFAEIDTD